MSFALQLLYPTADGATFNKEHYLSHHMPLVSKLWGPLGMTGWTIVEYAPGADGSKPEFFFGCTMTWESAEHHAAALQAEISQQLLTDVPNYFSGKPLWLTGGVIVSK
jgi:uncharacterized protein (TIGR02118 family)